MTAANAPEGRLGDELTSQAASAASVGDDSHDRWDERVARGALLHLAEPNDPRLWRFVADVGAVEALAAVVGGLVPLPGMEHYRARLDVLPADGAIERARVRGIRLVIPGDQEWPSQLDDLLLPGAAGERAASPPLGLWVRGHSHLRLTAARSVAIVGARAATSYGTHVAAELASGVSSGWAFAVFSGGAFGIDAAAHRGALAMGGLTAAVLACGVDLPYPRGNATLFDRIAAEGLLISELPPGCPPTRSRFLDRNRLIAALTRGTVVVEAAPRSGALNTVRWADRLDRVVLATPGPITSTLSAGAHLQIQQGTAGLVTSADDVAQAVLSLGEQLPHAEAALLVERARHEAERRPLDLLEPTALRVYDALPRQGWQTSSEVSIAAGLSLEQVTQSLLQLGRLGLVESAGGRWRLRPSARQA